MAGTTTAARLRAAYSEGLEAAAVLLDELAQESCERMTRPVGIVARVEQQLKPRVLEEAAAAIRDLKRADSEASETTCPP